MQKTLRAASMLPGIMLHYFKFRQDLLDPTPAREAYVKRPAGRGWPEECPPIRAANSFGFDLLANFDVTFVRQRGGGWKVRRDIVLKSDFDFAATEDSPGLPLSQQYAWFWEKGQKLPHVITDNVFRHIRDQVKVSSFLFLRTDPNELLLMTDVPNQPAGRGWRTMSAVVDTDWYPASYPWHVVLELSPREKVVTIRKGEPICRIMPLRRDTYFARPMSPSEFDDFYSRGQQWLAAHGRVEHESARAKQPGRAAADPGVRDITRTYVRQQVRSRFVVMSA